MGIFSKIGRLYGNIPAAKNKKEADELNKSFRDADYNRRKNFDFVVGISIRPSNNQKLNRDCCAKLAGNYPKSFKWRGWFDGCACHTVSILSDDDEFYKDMRAYLRSKNPAYKSRNEVKDYPREFKIMGGFKPNDKLTEAQAEKTYKRIYELYNNSINNEL